MSFLFRLQCSNYVSGAYLLALPVLQLVIKVKQDKFSRKTFPPVPLSSRPRKVR